MIRWSDNYITGITEIDEEHKKLFAVAAQIYDKVRSRGHDEKIRIFVLREGLHYLNGYFDYHAAREEAYMKKLGLRATSCIKCSMTTSNPFRWESTKRC